MNSPMPRPGQDLGALAMFAVVAEERSFTKAAVRLGVSRSAVSHAMQALEERLGLRLVARTTRAVSVTEAGQRLLTRLGPALESIDAALLDVGELRDRPAGRIRLIAPPIVLSTVLSPKLAAFTRTYPDIVLDITSEDDTRGDLVARRYDAGIHLGEFLQRDMTAVRVTREQRAAVVAAPALLRCASDSRRDRATSRRTAACSIAWAPMGPSTAGSLRSAASRCPSRCRGR